MGLFSDIDEPVQVKKVKKAGIYRKVRFEAFTFQPAEELPAKDGKEPVKLSARATLKLTVLEDIKNEKGDVTSTIETIHEEAIYCPSCTEADILYFEDKWEKGSKVGKKSATEQIKSNWEGFGMLLCQLGSALGDQFAIVKTKLEKYYSAYSVDTFKNLVEGFNKEYSVERLKTTYIDFKVIWSNNDKKKTSFLKLARANATNFIFMAHNSNLKESSLALSDYELKNCMIPKWSGNYNAPASNEEVIFSGGDTENVGMGNAQVGDEADLF
jgi:hypothetical protein